MTAAADVVATPLKQSPLKGFHQEHGAKMVGYAGWEMPLLYTGSGIIEEHRHCRAAVGFFDVSHMGRIRFTGRHARRFLDHICTRQVLGMSKGQVRYSLVCNERGGCLDDVLVYCLDEDQYLMVCNASNRAKLNAHFAAVKGDMVFKMDDQTESTAMVAVQGPKAMEVVGAMSREIPTLKRYRFAEKNLLVMKLLVSRTGYTGEDGVEIILGAGMAKAALNMFLKQGKGADQLVKPCGLGSRDSLRLEAGMPLYGHEIDEETDPLCAGLGFAVKLDKGSDDERAGNFIGQPALQAIAARGVSKKLVGLVLEGRRAGRQGMRVLKGGQPTGVVTSGCLSPTLDTSIAMAYVAPGDATVGTALEVEFAPGKVTSATVVPLPFYKPAA
ncbi:MAG: glycine cleavage system aminomethyltransferase GcvT [Planctomycetota bacterium]|nr:glycine cleavage system aminomethyltransferase GcvT [Planctomycetota bacterium]